MEDVLLMTFEHNEIEIQAGAAATAQLSLRNWGGNRMTYGFLPEGVPETWIQINPGQIKVNPGGEVAVTVQIKVPSDARIGHRTIIIHAVDQVTQLECGHAMIKLQVNAGEASPPPQPALRTRAQSSARHWVWIGGAFGAIVLLLVCMLIGNIYNVQGVPPAAIGLATTTPLSANAPPITVVLSDLPQPILLPPSPTASPTDSVQPRSTGTVTALSTALPSRALSPPTALLVPTLASKQASSPPPTSLPPFAITNLVTIVDPTSSTDCPTSFGFSTQITANGPGAATYYWEFSDGGTTSPAAVSFEKPEQALVQIGITFTQSTNGWGRVHVTSPTQLTSNPAAFTLTCPTPAAGSMTGSSQLPANPLTPAP